jgi:hypothetical protein
MLVLLYLDVPLMLASFLIHLCLLLGVSLPASLMAIAFSVVLVVVFVTRLRVTKELRQGNDWIYDKSLKGICPRWLKVFLGVILVYGILILVVSLRVVYLTVVNADFSTTDAEIMTASRNLHIGGFALMMMCYATESSLLYLYNLVRKTKLLKLANEGFVY